MWTIPQALGVLTLIAFAATALIAILGVWERALPARDAARMSAAARSRTSVLAYVRESALWLAWLAALAATGGSLYLSEVLHYPPCVLCWWQRIAMYPLVLVLGAGALRNDPAIRWYALPLAAVGALIAGYHTLLQRVPALDQATSCSAEAPCNVMWVQAFGFVSIPVMALAAFVLIGVLALIAPTRPAVQMTRR